MFRRELTLLPKLIVDIMEMLYKLVVHEQVHAGMSEATCGIYLINAEEKSTTVTEVVSY